jgi:DNA repair protein RadC
MLLMHNHPSGEATPSADDIAATAGLAALCRPLDIVLHDHLVVGGGSVVSMQRAGLLTRFGDTP